MKRKRMLAFVLAAAMVGGLVTGCGSSGNDGAEKVRLEKELERVTAEIARASGKLANQNFIAKAPKKLVEDERAKLEKLIDARAKVEERLKDF